MRYPTLDEVMAGDQLQVATWYKLLPSPGTPEQVAIMKLIVKRFKELGMTPAISKLIGGGS